uniref:Stabilin 2 n=1 Tax=Anolis carolinensis TaxID=28377 RepID=A0A803TMD2_ANOCA
MRKPLTVLFFLSSLIANTFSSMEMAEQGKNRCDEETLVTTKTKCRSCSLNYEIQCPEGYTKITNSSGVNDCRYHLEIRDFTLTLPGCRHICVRELLQPQCCRGYWGPDCLECPGGAVSPCNNKGRCFYGVFGNGTCTCQVCILCNCVHGICNSGITGDGKCSCFSGYKGSRCDQATPECQELQCPENSQCSIFSGNRSQLECRCVPNYDWNGRQCQPINPCSKPVCDPHADCFYLGPNSHKCICQYGYKGDGQVCMPIDPCQTNFGNCPTESTVCKYNGPGKSHCECKEHFGKFSPGLGCSMMDICATNNPCHKSAECTMAAPGQTLCTCQKGYVGDGFICYGNIMDQIRDVDAKPGGQWQGKLISAIELFENAYEWPLTSLGPFTVLVPTNKGFEGINVKDLLSNKERAQYFLKLHIFAGQLELNSLNNASMVYTLTGKPADILNNEKDNVLRIRIHGGKEKGKILQGDIVASNGIIHIIDKALDNVEPTITSDKGVRTCMVMLQDTPRYSRFRSILENSLVGPMLDIYPGPNTIFIPTNDALENLRDKALDYLLSSKGSRKLRELVQYHIVSHTQVSAIFSMLLQSQNISTEPGQILVNGVPIEETDITAKNGKIYTLSGVLIPPSIIPILPQRCDEEKTKIEMGTCVKCQLSHKNSCPKDSKPVVIMKMCLLISQEPNCCKGFFGPDCNQCPGGFSNPCSGNGQCMDKLKGNGTCICNAGFEGSHCQFCSDPNKYGPRCDQICKCVYGKCDNQIESDGICQAGSCQSGYAGKFCDTQTFPCGNYLQFCHAHADCMFSNGAMSVYNILCTISYLQAECIKTGPGTHECVCQPGWTGNGRDCSEINNCLLPNFGECHSNATCLYIGPGQNDCECKAGFRGNGYECESVNSCLEQSEKCHPLAVCQLTSSGIWECVCSEGYKGDGSICYGNAVEELSSLSEAAGFNEWIDVNATNLTILVPSRQAIQNMDQEEKDFWMTKDNILTLTRHHILEGAYTVDDLQHLSSLKRTAKSLHGNFLSLSKRSGVSLPVLFDILSHIQFAKVLTPPSGVSATLPKLVPRLEQMPDYSIFRGYIIVSIFALIVRSQKIQIRYHVILKEKLLKNDMHNGMFRETMLGLSFKVGFFIHDAQLYINEAPISYPNVATDKGIIHGVGKVMEIQKNRCDFNGTEIVTVSCALSYMYLKEFCIYLHYYRMSFLSGCQRKCAKTIITRECCAGFFGSQCEPCPGLSGNTCLGNGICLDGINGTGSCECEAGFEGVACEQCIKGKYGIGCDQECVCAHGRCNSGIKGDGTCECDVGWRGVTCETEIKDDECNSTCHTSANCFLNPGGKAYCQCAAGFKGNGTYCTAINACETSNGGCSAKAICKRTTPGNRVCVCKAGYTGDGIVCFEINPCLVNNGGCDTNAECTHTGPDQVSNGFVNDWISKGAMPQILRNHVVSCAGLLYNDLTSDKTVTTLQGDQLKITFSQDSVFLNSKAKILTSDLICTNGVIHLIDKILIPQRIQDFPRGQPNLNSICGNSDFFSVLFQSSGLMSLINDPLHQPITLFWPTDKVIRALPKDQQDLLFKMSDKEKLLQYLKFHIIGSAKIFAHALPNADSLKTFQGSELSVKCGDDDTNTGELFLNGRCKIVQRQLEFDDGIAYGIDCMLVDPVLGGRCDTFLTSQLPVSLRMKCYFLSQFYGEVQGCSYTIGHRILPGCQKTCSMVIRVPQCCKGYFGNECQACPGGPEGPCNNRGSCNEGYAGTGECSCNSGFNGISCELCLSGRYGLDCKSCECTLHGQCDEGISGSGQCFCETGWTGRLCETKLASSPVCSPNCSINAVCKEHNTCQCKPYYSGDGITCTAENLCKKANGGCHKNAKCAQTDVKVNCTCQKGYTGDGYSCTAINPCADGLNGGCDEHATCTMTGPVSVACECKDNYVGDGLSCEVEKSPVDRCLQNNGQCHANATCADLHFQDATVGVFHVRSRKGQYKLTFSQANKTCADEGATIATYAQLVYAQKANYHMCAAGWLADGRAAYPIAYPSPKCGGGVIGIIDYGPRINKSETWDVFCYRVKDVSCTCKTGYVGDGFTCSGNLLQVLLSFPTLTNFVSKVLTYFNSSKNGQEFLKYLENLSINATLFVPNNDGLKTNETLSGRDIEYHLSNTGTLYYEDLTNGTTLQTRIGKMLLITHGEDQKETKYVDGKTILEWDIIASNGVIHVIATPLKAPAIPALHAGVGTGIFFVILLIIGIVALVGYSYFRFKQGTIRFQHFEEKDDIDVTTLDKAQSPSISNPNYEYSTASPPDSSCNPFSVSDEQQLVNSSPLEEL